jgi:HK97 family phage prohead protease
MNPPFQNRLIHLSDGRSGLRSLLTCDITPPSPGPAPIETQNSKNENTLDFISSDATLDRYGEIISPEGWQLATYLKNPVFQNSHQYGDIIHTLGKAIITEVRTIGGRSALFQRIQFATDANPIARIAYPLYAQGYLRAVSVGFVPAQWEEGTQDTPYRRKYTQQELLEVSAVAIPANPAALALAAKSGALTKSDLQETIALLRQLTTAEKDTPPAHPTLAPLARLLSQILRHT